MLVRKTADRRRRNEMELTGLMETMRKLSEELNELEARLREMIGNESTEDE